ncbi:hypothetical protein CDL15_Pgr010404 [Punica granatum]|uniref:Uncharacterized protein n=1 Tax=Punica granatum TaxID=22663 RepID=A0A218W3S9_PUNGR|nr:hypothetical protein CDL15_Pgr010404 [Punica granatum]
MENVRLLRLSGKDTKSVKKKNPEKIQKNAPESDPHLEPIATHHATPSLFIPANPSSPTCSSVIPLLSPVYILGPPQFPESEDYNNDRSPRMAGNNRSPRMAGNNRSPRASCNDPSPRRERGLGDKKALSGKRHPSPTKLHDPTAMLTMFQSRCVL